MLAGALILAAMGAPFAVPVKSSPVVVLDRPEIRLLDVADLGRLSAGERVRLGRVIVARLGEGRSRYRVSRAALAALVRRALPELVATGDGEVTLLWGRAGRVAEERPCFALARPVSRGEPLAAEDLTAAPCGPAHGGPAVRFNKRTRQVLAAADLPGGTSLGHLALPHSPAVAAGEKLTLVARAGPVRIERSVTALQSGDAGGRIFVRDEEGQVTSAPVAPAAAAGSASR